MSLFKGGRLAVDVAVTSPLAATYERMKEPCEGYAATQKHGKYDVSFEGTDYFFGAMVFETLGAINVEGEEILKQFRFAAKRTRVYVLLWASLGTSLVHSSALRLASNLNRIDGQE